MTKREKILAALVLGVLLVWGAGMLKGKYDRALSAKRADLNTARDRLAAAELDLERGREAVERLEAWQQRSLPANPEVAQSLYRTWLMDRCKAAGLSVDTIQPAQRLTASDAYSVVGYTVNGRGTIKSLAALLFEFYRSQLLQQITRLQLRPATDPSQLEVVLQVEALVLPGSTNEELPTGTSDRLAKKNVSDYVASAGGRNLFAVYTPPRPAGTADRAAPPPPPEFDASKHAYVTGIVQVGGRLQAWITVRTTGEVLRLFEGDPVKVGLLEGKIVAIEPMTVVVEAGDKQTRVGLGKNLREGKAVATTEAG